MKGLQKGDKFIIGSWCKDVELLDWYSDRRSKVLVADKVEEEVNGVWVRGCDFRIDLDEILPYTVKPKTRKERIVFIKQKLGDNFARTFLEKTDRDVKKYLDAHFGMLKYKPDYQEFEYVPSDTPAVCLRCGGEVEVEHNHYCRCGMNKAVLEESELE